LNPSYFLAAFLSHLKESSGVFADLVASSVVVSSGVNPEDGNSTDRIRVELVSGNYFQVLGIQPRLADSLYRTRYRAQPKSGSGGDACILAEALRRIAGIIGKTLRLNGHPFTVIGVRRSTVFRYAAGFGPDAWAPR